MMVVYDQSTDELSLQCICGRAAMYSARVILNSSERAALKGGTLTLEQVNKELCDSDDLSRHMQPISVSVNADSLADLLSKVP